MVSRSAANRASVAAQTGFSALTISPTLRTYHSRTRFTEGIADNEGMRSSSATRRASRMGISWCRNVATVSNTGVGLNVVVVVALWSPPNGRGGVANDDDDDDASGAASATFFSSASSRRLPSCARCVEPASTRPRRLTPVCLRCASRSMRSSSEGGPSFRAGRTKSSSASSASSSSSRIIECRDDSAALLGGLLRAVRPGRTTGFGVVADTAGFLLLVCGYDAAPRRATGVVDVVVVATVVGDGQRQRHGQSSVFPRVPLLWWWGKTKRRCVVATRRRNNGLCSFRGHSGGQREPAVDRVE
mmetsp:Transcript_16043/g.64781  ORF Transcript_16043/g.64781 Transcript_16043/m.64781 type:complete len:302 (-) Transcript_16043:376-1281(-)